MGHGEDMIEDLFAESGEIDATQDYQEKMFREGMWETKGGEAIHYTEMSDQHLINTIRMLDRNLRVYDKRMKSLALGWIDCMQDELDSRRH